MVENDIDLIPTSQLMLIRLNPDRLTLRERMFLDLGYSLVYTISPFSIFYLLQLPGDETKRRPYYEERIYRPRDWASNISTAHPGNLWAGKSTGLDPEDR